MNTNQYCFLIAAISFCGYLSLYSMKNKSFEKNTNNFFQKITLRKAPFKKKSDVQHRAQINILEFSPDGNKLIAASIDQSIEVWDTKEQKLLHVLRKGNSQKDPQPSIEQTLCATITPNTPFIAISTNVYREKPNITIWNYETGTVVHTLMTKDNIHLMRIPPRNNNLIEAFSIDLQACVMRHTFNPTSGEKVECDIATNSLQKSILDKLKNNSFKKVAKLSTILVNTYKQDRWDFGSICVFDQETNCLIQKLIEFKYTDFKLAKLAISDNGNTIAAGGKEGEILLWKRNAEN